MNTDEMHYLILAAIIVGLWLLIVVFYVTYRDTIDK
jgi:hypothetical protein